MRKMPSVSRSTWARGVLLGLLWLWLVPISAATPIDVSYPQARNFFPQADRFGELSGQPRAAPAYQGKTLLGYLLLSSDIVQMPAYSGRPINTLIGLDRQGRIVGVEIVGHQEPILAAGISEQELKRYVDQYRGLSALDRVSVGAEREGFTKVDGISGATITVMVESATIMRAARAVAESRGLGPAAPPAGPAAKTASAAAPLPDEEPIWITVWHERTLRIGVLLGGLTLLTLILIFQDWFARRPMLLGRLRTGYLLFTLFFIGWYTLAQLSIINVLTFAHSLTHGFQWENFLIDPVMFILWGFVAMTLLLWGRGVYCGWLCPFGALQELVFKLGRMFRLKSFELPPMLHERLWAVKYIILLILFGLSLQSLVEAELRAEVEPFKTAITLRFQREWGYVLYAAGLVALSLLNRKFYCKYLCALGAALTIPAKFHIFDWLRRHRECGRPCQICAVECEVQAIKKNGEINPNECHYCLDCQVTYWSARKCPPLVDKRRRRERSARAREKVHGIK